MKTVTNKTKKPLRIKLPGGKTLFLGVTKSAQLRDEALEHGSVKKLLEAGDIEIVDGGAGQQHSRAGGAGKGPTRAHASGGGKITTGDR